MQSPAARPIIGVTNTTRQGFIDAYVNAVAAAGGSPLVLPVLEDTAALDPVLDKLDGVLFTGGSDIVPDSYGEAPLPGLGEVRPQRDRHELELLTKVLEHHSYPVLGICRGVQLLNVHGGGTLYQALEKQMPDVGLHMLFEIYPFEYPAHAIRVEPGSRLHDMLNTTQLRVNSFHHQAIKDVAPKFRVSARAEDGIVEAIEREGERFVVGLQWHPEMMAKTDRSAQQLFQAFVRHCC